MTYSLSPPVAHRVIGGEALLVDLSGSRMLGLNVVGTLVLSLLEDHEEAEIVRVLCDRYDVDRETAAQGVSDFVKELTGRELLRPLRVD